MVPVIDNTDDCAKHQATSLWFRSLQTPVSFCSTSALFTFHINAFLVLVRKELRKEQVCCEAEVMCLSFVVCHPMNAGTHLSMCACWCPQSKVAAQGVTLMFFCPSFLLQVCLMWGCAFNSAMCSKACWKGVWAVWWDINWNADTELPLLSLLWITGVVILGGGVLPSSWSGQRGERQRAIILETDICLLHGQIVTAREEGKPKFFGLALWSGGPLGHPRIFAVHLSAVMLLFYQCKSHFVACVS